MAEDGLNSARVSFERAMVFLRSGDSIMAESVCRQALNEFPRDANLLCLLGASLVKQDRAKDAEHTLSRAVRMYGNFSKAHEGLAEALILQGKLVEALECLDRAAELEPGSASIRMKRAKVLTGLGRDDDASKDFEQSFQLKPHREDLVKGLQMQRMGNLQEAEKIYREVLMRDPDNVDALRLMAGVAMRAKQWGDAEILLVKALELAPDFFQGWMDLGLARQEQDKVESALEAYRRATRLEPNLPNSYTAAGTTQAMAGQHDESISSFRQALKAQPGHPGALAGLGHVLKTIGQQAESIEAYRQCIQSNPSHGEAYWSLANLKTFRFEPEEIDAMMHQVEHGNLGDEPLANFHFALGKAFEDQSDYDRAFAHYRLGNETRRAHEVYDPVRTVEAHDQFLRTFTPELFEQHQGNGHPSAAPIFIVGLPRSGSTLLEQILASHSEVEGTHELPELGRVARSFANRGEHHQNYPAVVSVMNAEDLAELGRDYLQRTEKHRTGQTPRFTDKLPNNFVHVGLIKLILPNAKVIDARRHPLDSCLGSFKQLFARGQPFSYDLFELGEFYLEYDRIMNHWDTVIPGQVLRVQYEDVVSNLEEQVRRILHFCELPWEDSCLNFFETQRAVKTASSEQVRQPIYSSSVNTWKHYENHLSELIEILAPLLKNLPDAARPSILG